MSNKVAFLVPTWSGHRDYYLRFLESYKQTRAEETADLYCVIGVKEELKDYGECENALVIPPELSSLSREEGIINIKKLWGVKSICERYEYVIVLDDDTILNKKVDYLNLCRNWYSNRTLLGNNAYDRDIVPRVKETCKEFFDEKDRLIISEKEGELYLWFNQPCIYKSDTFMGFLTDVGVLRSTKRINFYSFDYYLYMYWLLCREDFCVYNLNAESEYGIYETIGKKQLKKCSKQELEKNMLQMTDYMSRVLGVNPLLRIHVDRKNKCLNISAVIKRIKIIWNNCRKRRLAG